MTPGMEKIWLVTFSDEAVMVVLAPDGPEAVTMAKRVAAQQEWEAVIIGMCLLQSAGFGIVAAFQPSEFMMVTTEFRTPGVTLKTS